MAPRPRAAPRPRSTPRRARGRVPRSSRPAAEAREPFRASANPPKIGRRDRRDRFPRSSCGVVGAPPPPTTTTPPRRKPPFSSVASASWRPAGGARPSARLGARVRSRANRGGGSFGLFIAAASAARVSSRAIAFCVAKYASGSGNAVGAGPGGGRPTALGSFGRRFGTDQRRTVSANSSAPARYVRAPDGRFARRGGGAVRGRTATAGIVVGVGTRTIVPVVVPSAGGVGGASRLGVGTGRGRGRARPVRARHPLPLRAEPSRLDRRGRRPGGARGGAGGERARSGGAASTRVPAFDAVASTATRASTSLRGSNDTSALRKYGNEARASSPAGGALASITEETLVVSRGAAKRSRHFRDLRAPPGRAILARPAARPGKPPPGRSRSLRRSRALTRARASHPDRRASACTRFRARVHARSRDAIVDASSPRAVGRAFVVTFRSRAAVTITLGTEL